MLSKNTIGMLTNSLHSGKVGIEGSGVKRVIDVDQASLSPLNLPHFVAEDGVTFSVIQKWNPVRPENTKRFANQVLFTNRIAMAVNASPRSAVMIKKSAILAFGRVVPKHQILIIA